MSHLLVTPLFSGLLCFSGLILELRNGIPHCIVPTALFGIVSHMGSALYLAAGLSLLQDSQFTWASRGRKLLGTSLDGCGSSCVVGRLYSIQYKSIFGALDKVRHNTCDKARPLSQV
jgi:hypothetical protein